MVSWSGKIQKERNVKMSGHKIFHCADLTVCQCKYFEL